MLFLLLLSIVAVIAISITSIVIIANYCIHFYASAFAFLFQAII